MALALVLMLIFLMVCKALVICEVMLTIVPLVTLPLLKVSKFNQVQGQQTQLELAVGLEVVVHPVPVAAGIRADDRLGRCGRLNVGDKALGRDRHIG